MIRPLFYFRRRRVVIDVDTQKDFFVADGHACVRNHRRVLANIRRVMAWSRVRKMRIISTVEIHSEDNNDDGDNNKSHYCIEGTEGQKKIRYTMRSRRISFAADGCTDLPRDLLANYDQVILHKRCENPFKEPRAERLLTELRADEFIVIGASMEGAVRATALGLLQRGKRVTVLTDAVGSHNKAEAEMASRQIQAKGGKLAETKAFAGTSCLHAVGACQCARCHPHKNMVKAEAVS